MALSQKVSEVRAMAALLWFLPPPAKNPIAEKMHGLGFRVHEDLATLEVLREGPVELGNHAPQYVASKKSTSREAMDALRSVQPEMAAKIEEAHRNKDIMSRIAAIKSPIGEDPAADAERAKLARELGIDVPDDVFATVDELKAKVDITPPGEFD